MNIRELSSFKKRVHNNSLRIRSLTEYINIRLLSGSSLPEKRLNSILDYAKKHCRYYNDLGINGNDLGSFPLLTKDIIREKYDDLISDEHKNLIYRDSYTGGSTGEPLHFLNQMEYDPIYQVVLWQRLGYKPGDIILSMDGTKVSEESIKNNYK